ncbi:MAG: cytochrome c3 family protein [Desulfobacteraceae bacterium]
MRTFGWVHHLVFGMIVGLLLALLPVRDARAMHDQVHCRSCHRMDARAENGVVKALRVPRKTLCLTCHDARQDVSGMGPPHVINGSRPLAGGSFTATLDSDNSGHNMLSVDADLGLTPPGGSPRSEFSCLSCHDPHPNGNFRNLKTEINGRGTWISAHGDASFEKNVYISGINNFCSACHPQFAEPSTGSNGNSWRRHPVGITIYGAQHADFIHWAKSRNKITLAEFPAGDPDTAAGARVFCLSCHVAHASPFQDALRWDYAQTPRGCLECHSF